MTIYNRRTTPKVMGGRVLRQNRHALTPTYWSHKQSVPVIDKERPGRDFRHLLRKSDIENFITLIPNWESLSKGLNAVVLAEGDHSCFGWYDQSGVIGICAWDKHLWIEHVPEFVREHAELFDRFGIEREKRGKWILCKYSDDSIRAFQLLHVFLHELGHHHDRMTTKSKNTSARGEPYADNYAFKYEAQIWEDYLDIFGPAG